MTAEEKASQAAANELSVEVVLDSVALLEALLRATSRIPASTAMMLITTRSSTRVKPCRLVVRDVRGRGVRIIVLLP